MQGVVYKPFIVVCRTLCRHLPDDSPAAIRESAVCASRICLMGFQGRAFPSITFLGIWYPNWLLPPRQASNKGRQSCAAGGVEGWHWS
jgi:hypothetical protein